MPCLFRDAGDIACSEQACPGIIDPDGLALNCRIASFSKWDRKSYYYPDLPKNYQISQFDLPVAAEGYFETGTNGDTRKVRIRRAHLEEDAGKNIHDTPGCTLVDLNRTGTPLLEIVTERGHRVGRACLGVRNRAAATRDHAGNQ